MQALAQLPRNAGPWRAIAEFLDAQHLALYGLTRINRGGEAVSEQAVGAAAARRALSAPHGNHGDNTVEVLS